MWTNMEARNQNGFIAAVGGLTVEEFERLRTKPKEALPRRYDAEMFEVLKYGSVRRIFTGGNAVVWPERFRKVVYYYKIENEVFKRKPQGRPLTSQVEQMFREEIVPPTGNKKEWDEVSGWPKCVADFEGDFELECYMTMLLMFRNHLGRVREAVGTTGMLYRDECRRVKQILLVVTPKTMV